MDDRELLIDLHRDGRRQGPGCEADTLRALDLIWSEGAIYNIGFEQGVRDWRPFLKEGGVLVASEREEIQLYERFQDCFSYGVYVARKTGPGDSA